MLRHEILKKSVKRVNCVVESKAPNSRKSFKKWFLIFISLLFYLIIIETSQYTYYTKCAVNAGRNRKHAKAAVMFRSMNEPNFTLKSV